MSFCCSQTQQKCCRICFEKTQDRSPLITPCQCKGSSLYIHVHCLEIWQQISLQNNLPNKAEFCPICKSEFTYPSKLIRFYRRTLYLFSNSWTFFLTLVSLFWISMVIVPLKVMIYAVLVCVTIPYGQLSLLGNSAVAWIGYEFPPQLAIIYTYPVELLTRNTWPLPSVISTSSPSPLRRSSTSSLSLLSSSTAFYTTLQRSVLQLASGVLLVASKEVPPASIFYRAVILLLDYNPTIGSRGVIINFDTSSSSSTSSSGSSGSSSFLSAAVSSLSASTATFLHSLPQIPCMRYGIGGPMESEVITVLHNYPPCARYSERLTIPLPLKKKELSSSDHSEEEEENGLFVSESRDAFQTLFKISEHYLRRQKSRPSGERSVTTAADDDQGEPSSESLSLYETHRRELKRKLKAAFTSLTRRINRSLLRPFPFLERISDRYSSSSEDQSQSVPPPPARERRERRETASDQLPSVTGSAHNNPTASVTLPAAPSTPHRIFKNPNYRELSSDRRSSHLSPARLQENLLSEVQERLQLQQSPPPPSSSSMISSSEEAAPPSSRMAWSTSSLDFPAMIEEEEEDEEDDFFVEDEEHHEMGRGRLKSPPPPPSSSLLMKEETEPLLLSLKGNCLWLASQLEGEVMHGFWHVIPDYSVSEIFSRKPEDVHNLWNYLIRQREEAEEEERHHH